MLRIPRLPKEYQEVEWIQASGTQWIDTGVIPTQTMRATIDCIVPSNTPATASGWLGVFGATIDYPAHNGLVVLYNKTAQQFRSINLVTSDSAKTKDKRTKIDIGWSSCTYYYSDGTSSTGSETAGTSAVTAPCAIFKCRVTRSGGDANYDKIGTTKVYRVTIYNNGTVINDFIPCYRISDGVIGMYDYTNNVFKVNAGSGVFSKGSDVTPKVARIFSNTKNEYVAKLSNSTGVFFRDTINEYAERLESLTSSGTQWIGTGFNQSGQNFKVDITGKFSSGKYYGVEATGSETSQTQFYYSTDGIANSWVYKWKNDKLKNNTKTNIIADVKNNKVICDGVTSNVTFSVQALAREHRIFCVNNGTISTFGNCTIYKIIIYVDDVVVKEFIPCRITQTLPSTMDSQATSRVVGTVGMWETVSNKFYGNQGTGTFTYA